MSLKILNPNTIGDPDKRKPGAASARSYVVAALSTAVISSVVVCNPDTVNEDTFYIYVVEASVGALADKTMIYKGVLPPGESFTAVVGISLGAGDSLQYKSDNGRLTFTVSGDESA